MFSIIRERLRQGYRTSSFPDEEPLLPDRFRGLPVIRPAKCPPACDTCRQSCPTGALQRTEAGISLDLGLCLFCGGCLSCPRGAVEAGRDYRLASRSRQGLLLDGVNGLQLATELEPARKKLFGRSLKLRQVSAGGCNACEADLNVLNTLVFDLGRFGIQFVASPRHADGLLVTGPVTENMKSALFASYEAVPAPKLVIASGACAIGGGPYRHSPETNKGIGDLLPVDLYIPGCPPHPYTTLDGLLRLLGRK